MDMPVIGRKLTAALLAALMICLSACGGNIASHGTETSVTEKTAVKTAAKTSHTAISGIIDIPDNEPPRTTTGTLPEITDETAETEETGAETDTTVTAAETAETTPSVAETSAETTVTTEITAAATAETTVQTTASTTANTTAETTAAPAPGSYDPAFFANDFFIGDSIYTGLTAYGYFPDTQVFAKIGLNPQSARTSEIKGLTAVSKAQGLQPKRIFIMLGSNGLAYMGNEYMANSMKQLVGDLQTVCPDSAVYVVSIPPVTKVHNDAGQETMEMVNDYNSRLKTMASGAGVGYLDLCSQLLNEEGYFSPTYAEADGLHFLGAAYKRMLSYFQSAAG